MIAKSREHVSRLGEVVVDVVQVNHFDRSGGQTRIVAASKDRTNLREVLLLRLLSQGLDPACPNLLREHRPCLAHQAGKNPGILPASRTDVGNDRAFAQTKVGEDLLERFGPPLRVLGFRGGPRRELPLRLIRGASQRCECE